ncbi:type I-C CRISPR-associated protein Cas5c [Magnetospirillum sp. UT-4]|uniref:type I-C CRISPR-associated protein Cas5c n=1 Tax=Magnetospirillum sp. UT-4 TaxID=2681467 RepID=UPI00137D43D6|nr:type I-C CRISPR-associated protein Cas5c [Magnetospirillum sp. UT-4]CAA7622828.1 CRISPR-associated protein Cas5 [Magnetospirillum sp. UT-4]
MSESHYSAPLRLRVWGDAALFTRPEMKVERVSYDVCTPSAARGILEAVLWKPEMAWRVERIDVLKPIRFQTVRRNEVGTKAANPHGIDAEDHRQQRASVILRDVDYVITARITLTAKAPPDTNLTKYVEMFRRRAANGQCFHRPCLGTREFAADFALVEDGDSLPAPIPDSPELGWMLLDIDHAGTAPVPLFFKAKLENGTLHVPPADSVEVRR